MSSHSAFVPRARGRIEPANLAHLKELSARRHPNIVQGFMSVTPPPTWDSVAMGFVGPVKDQSQCGSCWDFSGVGICEIAYNAAGVGGGPAVMILSEEYVLSCQRNGGCNGDDNTSVLQIAKATGLPLSAEYGPYTARAGTCAYKPSQTLYKIDDWGFVDGGQGSGVTSPDLIKAAIMRYKAVGCAVAAGPSWDSWKSDPNYVHTGNSNSIDHDVILTGWHDTGSKVTAAVGAGVGLPSSTTAVGDWDMRNSWSTSWANKGYGRIAYGADSIGTEAVFAVVNQTAPPIDWGQI